MFPISQSKKEKNLENLTMPNFTKTAYHLNQSVDPPGGQNGGLHTALYSPKMWCAMWTGLLGGGVKEALRSNDKKL